MKKWFFLFLLIIIAGTAYLFKDSFLPEKHLEVANPKQVFSEFRNFKPSQAITFESKPEFNPEINNNFGFLIWLKFREITNIDQRTFILRKYKEQTNTGYALAFNQFNDGFYPQIFWSAKENGNWLTFQKFKPLPNRWYGFLVTFTENKYLGLHLLRPKKKGVGIALENLGGYIMDDLVPANSAPLEVGSIGTKLFNGAIARISFFKSDTKKRNLTDFIEALKSTTPQDSLAEYSSYNPELKKIAKNDLNKKTKKAKQQSQK